MIILLQSQHLWLAQIEALAKLLLPERQHYLTQVIQPRVDPVLAMRSGEPH